MKIVTGGQSGVDRAALDVAIERRIRYAGWCPAGGWAEDFPNPPGLLDRYPQLRETPAADPAQRTDWNVHDSDVILVIVDAEVLPASKGTQLASDLAKHRSKPTLLVDLSRPDAVQRTAAWLAEQLSASGEQLALGIGGPRESEAPGIYSKAAIFLHAVLDQVQARG
jgi:Circularly permutated YpsA SLOG family